MPQEIESDRQGGGPDSRRGLWAVWAPALLVAAIFLWVAVATSWAPYTTRDLVAVAVLYGLLACTLHLASVSLAGLWAPLGGVAALGVAAVVLWHVREQMGLQWLRPAHFLALSSALAACYFPLLLGARRSRPPRFLAGSALLSAAALVGVLALAFLGSNTLRWRLLRQNKLIGTPAYFAWSRSVEALRAQEGSAQAGEPVAGEAPGSGYRYGPTSDAPTIVFLLVDTLRADSLAAYGGAADLMPNLNRFAEASVVFTDVLANATWTRPSVASFFTGLRQEEHGAVDRGDRLPERRVTLAEVLRGMGFETAAFVTNFAAVGRDAGFAQGFDHFAELAGGGQAYLRAEEVNAAVLRWLDARRLGGSTRPLFLYVHYLDPHEPYLAAAVGDFASPAVERKAYEAELRYLDRELGSFVAALRSRLPLDTAYLVTSDHGEEFGEHGESGHGRSVYSEVTDLPAILNVGGFSGRSDARLEGRDFFDLIVRVAAGETDPLAWATSRSRRTRYTSVHSTTASAWFRPYLSNVWMRGFEGDGRFLVWSAYGPTYELYDVADRRQLHNLADREPGRAQRMLRLMSAAAPGWSPRVGVQYSMGTAELLRTLGYAE
jgi:arylsulfatase A-like enzyme